MDSALREKSEICALLNEFLYLGFKDANEGDTISDVIHTIEANPDLKKLFVPVEELAETRCQLRKEGSGMQRLFKTINEASRKARKAKE